MLQPWIEPTLYDTQASGWDYFILNPIPETLGELGFLTSKAVTRIENALGPTSAFDLMVNVVAREPGWLIDTVLDAPKTPLNYTIEAEARARFRYKLKT